MAQVRGSVTDQMRDVAPHATPISKGDLCCTLCDVLSARLDVLHERAAGHLLEKSLARQVDATVLDLGCREDPPSKILALCKLYNVDVDRLEI